MKLLPENQILIKFSIDYKMFIFSKYEYPSGYMYFEKINLSVLINYLISLADFKYFIVYRANS